MMCISPQSRKKGYKKVKSVGKNTTKLTIRKFKGKKINPKKTYYMYVETKKKNGSKVNKSGRLYYWNTKSKNLVISKKSYNRSITSQSGNLDRKTVVCYGRNKR